MVRTFELPKTPSQNLEPHEDLNSRILGRALQHIRDTSSMDLAPDHFEYTDPQPESSKTAAARGKRAEERVDSGNASMVSGHKRHDSNGPAAESLSISIVEPPNTQPELPEHRWDRGKVYKSKLACPYVCQWHQVCWQSQYTRPVAEMLKEVLEVRYPHPEVEEGPEAQAEGDMQRESNSFWRRLWRKSI